MNNISIIIVNYNSEKFLKECIDSIVINENNTIFEFIIYDNGSSDGLQNIQESYAGKYCIKILGGKGNIGFAAAVNKSIGECNGNYLMLVNPDLTFKSKKILDKFIYHYEKYNMIILAPKIIYPNGVIQSVGEKFPTLTSVFLTNIFFTRSNIVRKFKKNRMITKKSIMPVDWVTGACLLIRKDKFIEHGFFDEAYWLYGEDLDFCRRIHELNENKIYVDTNMTVVHFKGGSTRNINKHVSWINSAKGQKRYFTKYKGFFSGKVITFYIFLGILFRIPIAVIKKHKAIEYIYAARSIFLLLMGSSK